MLIRNVRPWGREAVDVKLEGARISAIRPHTGSADGSDGAAAGTAAGTGAGTAAAVQPSADPVLQGRGRLLLPSFSDVHVHLDSTRIGLPFREHTGGPGVWAMMMNDRANWRNAEVPLPERVAGTLERMIAYGTTRVRSFAQIDVDAGLEKFEAVLAAREKFADAAEVQVMAFPQAGLLIEPGTIDLLEESLKLGATVMGGIDPCQLDRDPVRHLDVVFDLAVKYDVDVDIHLHEPGQLAVFSAELVFERVKALGLQGRVTLSHAYELGAVSEAVTSRMMERMAELDISWTTIAPARTAPQFNLAAMSAAGVRVGLGQDGQRDYWSPYGNCDLLDRTWQLAFTHQLRRDEAIEHCAAIASIGGASIMDRTVPRLTGPADRPGLAVGDRADLLLCPGETVTSAIMDREGDRTVVHDGRVVADGLHVIE